MPASTTRASEDSTLTPAETREREALRLLIRASLMLSQWRWKYVRHNPHWPAPSADLRLQADIDAWIEGE